MTNSIRGSCENFCPEYEVKLRSKEHLLHFYELKSGQKNAPGILVKEFSRSAAGCKVPRSKDLRTFSALHRTLEYLLKEIVLDKRKPFHFVYDFIFDRLRAVRQEIVMQDFDARQTIQLLEPMIMFLAYSRYRLCTEQMDRFDKKICNQHLQECLKRALCCYDEIAARPQHKNNDNLKNIKNRIFVESLYQVFNLGSIEAIDRCIQLPPHIKHDSRFELAYSTAIHFSQGQYFRVFNAIDKFPHILSATASLNLPHIRRQMLRIFSHAYSNKMLSVPIMWLQKLLLYSTENDVINDCKHYNITVSIDSHSATFFKSHFSESNEPVQERHEKFVEDKLNKLYLPEVLLLKKL